MNRLSVVLLVVAMLAGAGCTSPGAADEPLAPASSGDVAPPPAETRAPTPAPAPTPAAAPPAAASNQSTGANATPAAPPPPPTPPPVPAHTRRAEANGTTGYAVSAPEGCVSPAPCDASPAACPDAAPTCPVEDARVKLRLDEGNPTRVRFVLTWTASQSGLDKTLRANLTGADHRLLGAGRGPSPLSISIPVASLRDAEELYAAAGPDMGSAAPGTAVHFVLVSDYGG